LLQIPKKASLSDSDLVEQSGQLCLPNGTEGEALEILMQGLHLELLHPAAATVPQQTELAVRVKNSSHQVNQVSDAH